MNTKLMTMLAASTLVLAACGGAEVDTADAEYEDGAVETALSDEQPPLEGDSPFVDAEDVAESTMDEDAFETALDDDADIVVADAYELRVDGADEPRMLMIDPDAETATLDGETYDLAMDGERFSFDAPTLVDGEEELMTYSGLYRDGLIEDGRIEAQGDGASMTFEAMRAEADAELGELRTGVTDAYREGKAEMDELGNEIEATGEKVEQAGENAYDRATDGSDATEALDPVDED